MPWKLKKQVWMILLGCVAIVLGIFVAIRDKSVDTRLLAVIGVAGGFAIILNTLPTNGGTNEH